MLQIEVSQNFHKKTLVFPNIIQGNILKLVAILGNVKGILQEIDFS